MPPLASPDAFVRPHETLGTHPDLVGRLWDELPAELPVDCRVVFYGMPALMHPTTGIVLGFAGGTHTYALRLPSGNGRKRSMPAPPGSSTTVRSRPASISTTSGPSGYSAGGSRARKGGAVRHSKARVLQGAA